MLENMVIVPLVWLSRGDRRYYIQKGYEVIPIPGYQETDGFRACKIIGKYTDDNYWIRSLSIPIWEDWKLTARYAAEIERSDTIGQQIFDRLDDDEKIQSLKYCWFQTNYIVKYFEDHPDFLEHARHILKLEEIHNYFKDLFGKC